jgi:hypothetical protein
MFFNLIVQDPFVSYHVMLVLFISVGEVKTGGMGCTQKCFFFFRFVLFLQEATFDWLIVEKFLDMSITSSLKHSSLLL